MPLANVGRRAAPAPTLRARPRGHLSSFADARGGVASVSRAVIEARCPHRRGRTAAVGRGARLLQEETGEGRERRQERRRGHSRQVTEVAHQV